MTQSVPRSHYASIRKAYDRARDYWQRSGDTQRAQLTNEELDEVFAYFDGDGVPFLITDPDYQPDVVNPFAELADWAAQFNFHSGQAILAEDYDELLNRDYANYLLNRVEEQNEPQTQESAD